MTLDRVWGCSWCLVCLISLKFSDNVGMLPFFIWYFLKTIFWWTSSPQTAHFKCLKTYEQPCITQQNSWNEAMNSIFNLHMGNTQNLVCIPDKEKNMEEIIQCHWYFFVLFWKLIKLKHKYPIVNSYINTPNLVCVRAKEKQNVSRKKIFVGFL